jgi:alpha-tubulin suppressor-like RCC1 family protein
MRVVGLSLVVIGGALSACSEEFTADDGAGGGTQSSAASATSGVGAAGGGGTGGGGTGGGEVVGDCENAEDCQDKPGTSCVEGKCTCPSAAPDYCVPEGCVDTSSTLLHCGGCDAPCDSGPHGERVCERGTCGFECHPGFDDCNEQPGCETPVQGDPSNCGGCGVVCATECVDDLCNDPVQVVAGENHTCARRAGGSVWCWGANNWGQIGANTGTNLNPVPVEVTLPPGRTATRIAAGGRAACAELDDKTLFCWGGTGNNAVIGDAVAQSDVGQFAVGGTQGCAVKLGVIRCWTTGSTSGNPLQVLNLSKGVGVGGQHGCGIKNTDAVECWGDNGNGQLGDGSTTDSVSGVPVAGLANVEALALGKSHSCALTGGKVWCWGLGNEGQLGNGSVSDKLTPTEVPVVGNVEAIYPSFTHSGARIGDRLWMWGKNDHRQAADKGLATVNLPTEYEALVGVTDAALGGAHTCALLQSGQLLCWGTHVWGVLGNGLADSGETTTPTLVGWD